MARKIIPIPGEGLQFVFDNVGLVHMKTSVATYNDLPITGNTENDVRITRDTDNMYTWTLAASSGTLNDWLNIGPISSIDWSAITNKPTSSVADIDDAVAKRHTHANKALLDTYDQTNADISDAVSKKHTQNTDTDLDPTFEATFVKKVDNVNVLADISSPGADIEDAVTKKHTQGTDQALDTGGGNEVSAAQAKGGYDHSQGDGSDHSDVAANTAAQGNVGTKSVDEAQIGDDKVPTYDLSGDKMVYKNRISVQGGITYFLHEEISDVATYQKILGDPADDPETSDNAVVNSGSGEVLIKSFVTDPGIPGTTLLSDGVWSFQNYASVSADAQTSTIVIRVYKRTTGGVETELFNLTTNEINGSSAALYEKDSVQDDFQVNATDRLVIKYFAQTTSGSDKTITLYYEGMANYTHVHTPFISLAGDAHVQNTDTGTTSPTFAIDTEASGFDPVKIKNESGTMATRNNADNDYIDFKAKNIVGVDGEFTGEIGDASNKADADTILTSSLEFVIDGGGDEIPTGIAGDLQVPFDCEIIEAVLLADQTGSIVVDIWKDTYANFPPVVGDTITASAKPTISSGIKDQDSTLTGWTTSITAGDTLRFNVDSITTISRCTVILKVRKI